MSKISELTALAEVPASTDEFVIVDKSDTTHAASGTTKRIQSQYVIPDASETVKGKVELATTAETETGTDATRAVTPDGYRDAFATTEAAIIHAATSKATPVDADEVGLVDSAASNILKKLTWANIRATLLTWLRLSTTIIPQNAPQGFLINGKISVTDAAGITVAIKTIAGTDPSATDPVYCRIGDTVRSITSALSVAKADGTNWCNAGSAELATKEIDYFVYLGYNATDGVVIGFSRYPGANSYDDFSATSTNEKYCAISTITNAAATDYYEVVGRFAATLSAGAGYTWSVPTYTAKNLIQRPIYETRWLSYNCTGPTNCNITAKYRIVTNTCFIMVVGSFTGSTAWSTQPTIPFAPSSVIPIANSDYGAMGVGGYLDNGTGNYTMGVIPHLGYNSLTTFRLDASATSTQVSATVPITWANGDIWWARLDYPI